MTTQELVDYYANLLILQYRQKSKAYASIQALVKMPIMDQLPVAVQDAFDIDTAVGVQLDVLSEYVGVQRDGYGFDGNPITLDDDELRILFKFAIIRNSFGSSLAEIQELITDFFPGEFLVFDHLGMRMSYLIDSNFGSFEVIQMLVYLGLFPKPMAVQVGAVYWPIIDHFFGFRTYLGPGTINEPFNSYDVYETDRPWLSYETGV